MNDEEARFTDDGAEQLIHRASRLFAACVLGFVSLCFTANPAWSQSMLADAPTPLTGKVIEGRIAPRDIGDSRTTTYFFTFDTAQGDLEFSVITENLDGDIDLYVLGSLQPLTKVTLLATNSASEVRRTIFVRDASPLLLRVQARSSGDAVGTYRISFDGAFLPSTRANIAANDDASKPSDEIDPNAVVANRSTQRVNAVGGRIEQPIESARAPSLPDLNTARDDANDAEDTIAAPRPTRRTPRRTATTTARRRAPRPPRPPTIPARRRTPPPAPDVEPEETTDSAVATPPPTTAPVTNPPPSSPRRRANTTARTRTPAAPRPARASRLIIRTRDGARTERSMSEVERVTIEGGELIVVLKNGETQRLDLSDVLRFTVEP